MLSNRGADLGTKERGRRKVILPFLFDLFLVLHMFVIFTTDLWVTNPEIRKIWKSM